MRTYRLTLILLFLFCNILISQSSRILTYNIRYANDNPGEEWEHRKENVVKMIKFHNPDIFGVQEALLTQVEYLSEKFCKFSQIGVGRDDGNDQGEFSPLYISDKYSIIESGTFWLSETPDTPSFGWDANYRRIATWAIIVDSKLNNTMFVINTHLDHEGIVARIESVNLLLKKIDKLSRDLPVILLGDFNFTSDFEGYKNLLKSGSLKDAQSISKLNYGTDITFNGFDHYIKDGSKIDYIFVSNDIKVYNHAIIGDKLNGKYPSDHMPVLIDFKIEK